LKFEIIVKSWFYLILHDFSPILLFFNFYMILHNKYMLTYKIIWFYMILWVNLQCKHPCLLHSMKTSTELLFHEAKDTCSLNSKVHCSFNNVYIYLLVLIITTSKIRRRNKDLCVWYCGSFCGCGLKKVSL